MAGSPDPRMSFLTWNTPEALCSPPMSYPRSSAFRYIHAVPVHQGMSAQNKGKETIK